jgi:hypothetical protein
MTSRFIDEGQKLYDFADLFYVRCPHCSGCARVLCFPNNRDESSGRAAHVPRFARLFDPRRLSCPECGYTKDWRGRGITRRNGYDWYFGLPLWLQAPCCGSTLWAFNEAHLNYLERFVAATQRPPENARLPVASRPGSSRPATVVIRSRRRRSYVPRCPHPRKTRYIGRSNNKEIRHEAVYATHLIHAMNCVVR